MEVKAVLCLLSFVQLLCVVFSKDKISIGVISDKNEQVDAFNWGTLSENIADEYDATVELMVVPESSYMVTTNFFCRAAAELQGLVAVFGSENEEIAKATESVCSFVGIPYISTIWTYRDPAQLDTTFSLYPEASLLAQAYRAIVESLDYARFAVVYENEESLVRLQDVLKLQEYREDYSKNKIILKQLDKSGDSRHIFKEIRNNSIYWLVLDCNVEKIMDLLFQAKDVKFLDDLNANIFLTSLDAHTLDFSVLNARSNITTVRLFDPSSLAVQKHTRNSYPDSDPYHLTVKMALMHDAMLLLAESLNAIKSTHADGEIVYEPLFCNASEKYDDKYGLVSALQETELNGITGEISLKNGKREKFEISIVEIDNLDKPIGIWNANDPNQVHLTRNATEREAELQRRLQSHSFIVTSRIGPPYLFERTDTELVGNARYYGYSMDLITEIAKLMNITFEFRITKDNAYLNLQKDLIERRADLAICDFTITPQRREVIDFSMPFMTLGIGILHKKAEEDEETNLYGFLGPLSTVVWLYIGLLYIFVSFILVLVGRMSNADWENPHPCDENPSELENIWNLKNCCWLTLGSITTQGCDILPNIPSAAGFFLLICQYLVIYRGGCTRIATASWWFFSLIITSSYTANLAAFLTMSKKDDSIDTVEELATQSKVKYGCLSGGATTSFFQFSNNTLYQRMWNTMINEKPSVFEDSNQKGMERVQSTKNGLYAFFMESTQIEYVMERKCDLKRVGDLLDSKSYGIGMPMNADYRHSINAAVLRLQETGRLVDLKEKWWKIEREGEPCPVDVPEDTDALALVNVGGVFIVLGAGIGLAFLIAILEFLWNTYSVAVEEHISFMEALKIELKFACNIFITQKRVKPLLSESSSSKSEHSEDNKSNSIPLIGSFLNVNSASHRNGSTASMDKRSERAKSGSKRGS